jgi:hypothetical protein
MGEASRLTDEHGEPAPTATHHEEHPMSGEYIPEPVDTTTDCHTDTEEPTYGNAEYVDTDGDGYTETVLSDTDGDGYTDQALVDVDYDGQADIAGYDNRPDEEFVADVVAVDATGDGVADVIFDDLNFDGTFDSVIHDVNAPIENSNPYAEGYEGNRVHNDGNVYELTTETSDPAQQS